MNIEIYSRKQPKHLMVAGIGNNTVIVIAAMSANGGEYYECIPTKNGSTD